MRPLGSFPERFKAGIPVLIAANNRPSKILAVRQHTDGLILRLEGVNTRSQAEELRFTRLLVSKADRHPLPDNVYYVDDLLGLTVKTVSGQEIGTLVDVLENPANDLFEVQLKTGEKALIPAVKVFVEVNLDSKEVIIDPIPGLLPEGFNDAD